MPVWQEMKLLGNKTLLVYTDDIIVIGNLRTEVITIMADLIVVVKLMALNQKKTKFVIIDKRSRDTPDLIINNCSCQYVVDKYLVNNLNNTK